MQKTVTMDRPVETTAAPTAAPTAVAFLATVGLATVGWILTIQQMQGMDMGVATRLGSFPTFVALWAPMMAAMMLPGIAPAARRIVLREGQVTGVVGYVGGYLAVWGAVGLAVYGAYRPHGTVAAGVCTVAAGVYELTPAKRRFRDLCRDRVTSGLELGLCCLGSTIGLMLMMLALGVMSLTWMAVVSAVVLIQKLLPAKPALDAAVAVAILGLGVAVLAAPSAVPGLVPPM